MFPYKYVINDKFRLRHFDRLYHFQESGFVIPVLPDSVQIGPE